MSRYCRWSYRIFSLFNRLYIICYFFIVFRSSSIWIWKMILSSLSWQMFFPSISEMEISLMVWYTISIVMVFDFCFGKLVFQFSRKFAKFRANFLSFLMNNTFIMNLSIRYDKRFLCISILTTFLFVTD